jgi:hypothetical protein
MADDSLLSLPRSRFRAAMILALTVDALQIIGSPLLAEGALSPLDDILDQSLVMDGRLKALIAWVNLSGRGLSRLGWNRSPRAPHRGLLVSTTE